MVVYNDNPKVSEYYHRRSRELSDSMHGNHQNLSRNGNGSIDGIILQPSAPNELYQKKNKSLLTPEYDLVQPLWFEAIMKRIADEKSKNAANTSIRSPAECACYGQKPGE